MTDAIKAAVRAALEALKRDAETHRMMCRAASENAKTDEAADTLIGEAIGVGVVSEMIDDMLASLDAAPSAKPEGDADA